MSLTALSRKSLTPQIPYACLVLVLGFSAVVSQSLSNLLPGISDETLNPAGEAIAMAIGALVWLALAWWLVAGTHEPARRFVTRFARDCGLARPTRNLALGDPDSARGLSVRKVLLLFLAVTAAGILGHHLILNLFADSLTVLPRDQDPRYYQLRDAPVASALAMIPLRAPIPEELVFRGLPLLFITTAQRHFTPRRAHLFAAVIGVLSVVAFAIIHIDGGTGNVLTAGLSGTLYLLVALATRSVLVPIAAHTAHNVYVYGVWLDWWPS